MEIKLSSYVRKSHACFASLLTRKVYIFPPQVPILRVYTGNLTKLSELNAEMREMLLSPTTWGAAT
jgi:hypothetical protein